MPLNQDEIAAKVIGQLELVMKEIISVRPPLDRRVLREGNVGSLRKHRIRGRPVQLVGHERQRTAIEACLRGNFTRRYGAGLHLKMSLVMSRENAFNIDGRACVVASLNDRRESSVSDCIWRIIIVVIANLSTASFRPSNVEAVRAGTKRVSNRM